MIRTVKVGEVKTEMLDDMSTTDTMNVFLRIGWGAETTSRIDFKPAVDLKAGDGVKVTIEKIYVEPDPEPEPEPVKEAATGELKEVSKAEDGEEAAAVETTEALKPGGKNEIPVEEVVEAPSEMEGKKEDTAGKE